MGGTYTHEFAGGTKAIAHLDYSYDSPVQIVEGLSGFPASVAQNLKREVNSLNASFTVRLTNGIDVGVWGRNLTNAQYRSAGRRVGKASVSTGRSRWLTYHSKKNTYTKTNKANYKVKKI